MSEFAPRITTVKVPVDKIGEVIGPKGKMINSITEETGADISIEDDGTIYVGAADGPSAQAAIDRINAIANPQLPKIGERFLGTVVKTAAFGAFVSLLPGRDGLVHISKLGGGKRIGKVEDVANVGDKMRVEITDIDNRGKISLIPVKEDDAAAATNGDGGSDAPASDAPAEAESAPAAATSGAVTGAIGRVPESRQRSRPALSVPPSTGPGATEHPAPGVARTVLPGGLRVVTEHVAGARSASVGLWVDVGSRDEPAVGTGAHGAAHFLEHLLFKGTRRRSARAIAEEIDAVGGDLNAFTGKESTCFYAHVLDRDMPLAVDVLGDVVLDAVMAAADVELERDVVLSEIAGRDEDPEDLLADDFDALLFGAHPLGLPVIGTEESVTGMTRDRLADFHDAPLRARRAPCWPSPATWRTPRCSPRSRRPTGRASTARRSPGTASAGERRASPVPADPARGARRGHRAGPPDARRALAARAPTPAGRRCRCSPPCSAAA